MNRPLLFACLLAIISAVTSLSAQKSSTIDSLQRLLAVSKEDTSQVNLLNDIGYQYSNINPDTAIMYCSRAIKLAEKLNYRIGVAKGHRFIGTAYDSKGDLKKAHEQYFTALRISKEIQNPKEIASSSNDIGIIYFEMGKYDSAQQYFFRALHLKDSLNEKKATASTLNNIALVYGDQGNVDKAIEYLYKALAIDEQFNNTQGVADSYLNIGTLYKDDGNYPKAMESLNKAVQLQLQIGDKEGLAWSYNEIGACYEQQGDYVKAMENYKMGHATATEIELKIMIGYAHLGMGNVYKAEKEYALALSEYQKALQIAMEVGDTKAAINAHNGIGTVLVAEKNADEAIARFEQGLRMSKESGLMAGMRDSYHGLSQAYEVKNNLRDALHYFKLFTAVNDSLLNIEKQEKVALLHTQYETQKKDEEISLLNTKSALQESENRKQKIQRNAFIAGFVLVLALAFLLYNSYRIKNKANTELEAKNKVIQEQKLQVEEALTELQQSEKQLIQAEKMASLGQLTAGIAHEINNPINFVSGNINPLKRNFDDLKELIGKYEELLSDTDKKELWTKIRKEYDVDLTMSESASLLKGIEEGSKRTAEIVKGLRNFSRLDESEMKKIDINEGIASTLMLLQNKFAHQNIEVVKSLGDIPHVDGYAGQINQVIMNLLTNAIDAIGANGKIYITTTSENSSVKISIRDTGNGMSEDIKRKIFDPFFTTKEVGKGSGLGLSISYGIIEKHRGQIDLKSEVGKGTEFIVQLPVVRA